MTRTAAPDARAAAAAAAAGAPKPQSTVPAAPPPTADPPPANDGVLGRVVPGLNLSDVQMTDVVDFLQDVSGAKVEVDWAGFDAVGIKRTTVVKLDVQNATFRQAIIRIFRAAGATADPVVGLKPNENGKPVVTVDPGRKQER